jgi:hypothetical protein
VPKLPLSEDKSTGTRCLRQRPFYSSPESARTSAKRVTCMSSTRSDMIDSDFGYPPTSCPTVASRLPLRLVRLVNLIYHPCLTFTDLLGARLPSTATCCCNRAFSPADPRAKDALSPLHMEGRNTLALCRNSKVITFILWRGIRVKHHSKQQQQHGPLLTVIAAKALRLEQAQSSSALQHSQAFLISLGAQRQAGRRRDKHWDGRSCMSWMCLIRLPRTTLAPTRMRLRVSRILHFFLGEGSMVVCKRSRSPLGSTSTEYC